MNLHGTAHGGPGRPGWHIECSVMSMKHGDKTLDIHAGGQDLIFPHHENEIAQSEAANDAQFSKYWLHNGFLDIEGEKMSKSLGNFLTVKDILKKYDPIVIRMFFLLKHYRSPIDFSEERIKEAKAALDRLRNAYHKINYIIDTYGTSQDTGSTEIDEYKRGIEDAMDDDFNTGRAMGYFFDIAKGINSMDEHDPKAPVFMSAAKKIFDTLGTMVFGITFETQKETDNLTNDLMDFIIELRQNARAEKKWALADKIRDRLQEIGIVLEDYAGGTSWKHN